MIPAIHQTSLFTFDDYASFEARMAGRWEEPLYTRVKSPTVAAFKGVIADLERGKAAVGFASRVGAISVTLLALVRLGQRVACGEHVHPNAYQLMGRLLRPTGWR